MVKTIEVNISPFRMFLGKIIPNESTEWLLIRYFNLNNLSTVIDDYFKYVETKAYVDPDYDQLFNILSIFKTAITRRTPHTFLVLDNIEVTDFFKNESGKEIIKVRYTYDSRGCDKS